MKGSLTVEAALLCPFLCLLVCAMIVVTFFLYDMVSDYGEEAKESLKGLSENVTMLRIERMIFEEGEE